MVLREKVNPKNLQMSMFIRIKQPVLVSHDTLVSTIWPPFLKRLDLGDGDK